MKGEKNSIDGFDHDPTNRAHDRQDDRGTCDDDALTMPMQKDFLDARQFQRLFPLSTFLAVLGFVLPVRGVPKASDWRR